MATRTEKEIGYTDPQSLNKTLQEFMDELQTTTDPATLDYVLISIGHKTDDGITVRCLMGGPPPALSFAVLHMLKELHARDPESLQSMLAEITGNTFAPTTKTIQ